MSRCKRKSRENSRKRESSRLTFLKKSKGLGLFPTSDFDGVCTQNQCLLSADFVFQELRRTHIPLLVVYKCALAIASGKIKLIHSEKIYSLSGREKNNRPNCQRLSLTAQADFHFCGKLEKRCICRLGCIRRRGCVHSCCIGDVFRCIREHR